MILSSKFFVFWSIRSFKPLRADRDRASISQFRFSGPQLNQTGVALDLGGDSEQICIDVLHRVNEDVELVGSTAAGSGGTRHVAQWGPCKTAGFISSAHVTVSTMPLNSDKMLSPGEYMARPLNQICNYLNLRP